MLKPNNFRPRNKEILLYENTFYTKRNFMPLFYEKERKIRLFLPHVV